MSSGGRRPPGPAAGREDEVEELRALVRSLRAEVLATQSTLRGEVAENERKLRRAQDCELELLRAETLPELFEVIVRGLRAAYAFDAVSLVLEDPNHEIRHLLIGAGDHPGDFPGVAFADTLMGLAPQFASLHRPWLGSWVRPDHELLFPGVRELGSIALLPLRRQGRTSGVLCFGSRDPERFTHRHATDIQQHLASIVAVCLENACNRARVLRSGLADYLTGWNNRRYLHARLREELARAQRQGGSVACLMLDIDWFKAINDTFGHLGGDEAIREIASRIEGQIRASDTAARFGGDEFALLLPETTLREALTLAERVRAAMAPPVQVGAGRSHVVTLSIGAAAVQPTRADADLKSVADRLLADADAALYAAKAAGRDRVAAPPGALLH